MIQKSKSRNADFISIARRAIHSPQRRSRCRSLSEGDAQRTHFEGAERRTKCSESFPLWGHNPSTQPAAKPRPFSLKSAPEGRHHHPLNLLNPLNPGHPVAPMGDTTTLGPVKLKNLFPQPFYTTHGGAVPLRAQQARPTHALASTRKISPARKKRI